MSSVQDHYATHLASIYLWMSGGVDAANILLAVWRPNFDLTLRQK